MSEKISLSEHMLNTQMFLTSIIEEIQKTLPGLIAVQKIRKEIKLRRLSEQDSSITKQGI